MEKAHEIDITQAYDEPLPYTYAISSYGTDFDVEGLIRRLEREDIYLPPFQRVVMSGRSSKLLDLSNRYYLDYPCRAYSSQGTKAHSRC